MMVSDHINYLTFEDPAAVNLVRRALKLAEAGDLHGAAETAGVEVGHAAVVSEGLRKGMRFSIGAEVDNDPRARPDAQNIVDAMRPDGMIRSVHFLTIEHPEKGADFAWPFDNPEFVSLYDHVGLERTWELYMTALLDAIEKLPGQIIGHFYAPAKFGHWPPVATLEKYEDRFLDACAKRGLAIEINARFLYRDHPDDQKRKYLDANRRLIKKAKAKGVGIAIGSDAHSPKDQGAGFDAILKLLDDAKVNELIFPVGGRLARVALRATKEHLERRAATTEAPMAGSSISGFSRAELAEIGGLDPEAAQPAGRGRGRTRAASPKERAAGAARAAKGSKRPSEKPAARAAAPRPPSKKAAVSKPAAKAVPAKPASKPPTNPAAKKAAGKKPVVKKTAPKKAPPKKVAVKKVATKKPAPKKAGAARLKKAPLRKPVLKKKAAVKKPPARKPAAKKAPPKRVPATKSAPKKTAATKSAKKKAPQKRR